ncbi:MAG: [NiFe]-hydrogenase assembly chaperone HybE [bacterium]
MRFSNAPEVKQAFEEVYTQIFKTRFWGLPITNHRLSVQVVGLRETTDFYTFSLITPWMLNQVAVPKKEVETEAIVDGMRLDHLQGLGQFFVTNVVSPMNRFKSMEIAIRKGERQAEQLFARISNENKEKLEEISRRDFFLKVRPQK